MSHILSHCLIRSISHIPQPSGLLRSLVCFQSAPAVRASDNTRTPTGAILLNLSFTAAEGAREEFHHHRYIISLCEVNVKRNWQNYKDS
jgi:hypothetical protein